MSNTGDKPFQPVIRSILVVDDDDNLRALLTRSLAIKGYAVVEAENAEVAYGLICQNLPDLVLSDIAMPGIDGITFMKKTRLEFPDLDFIIMTGYAIEYSYVDIMDAGASDYMTKPFSINSVVARINRIEREKQTLFNLRNTNLELNKAMEKANRLAEEAESASRAKTDFLARMSHEIRTPLSGIIGYTDILFDTSLSDEQEEYVKSVKISCEALLMVVNDILDFSKVEAGQLRMETIDFDPEVLCFETLELIRPKVDEQQVELICSISESVPGLVTGDPHRFRQVLLNLLGNAAKFTHRGEIELSLECTDGLYDHDIQFHVCVRDTGIGVPSETADTIFEPFQQCEDTTTRRYEGTGLGLAISRKIVETMNGRIWVEANPGGGSCFHFTCRVVASDKGRARRVRPVALEGKKILLLMENRPARETLMRELSMAGMEVLGGGYGEKVATAMKKGADRLFDIGIVDTGALDSDRIADVVRDLRRAPGILPGMPLIACSSPDPGEAERCKQAGFQGFLPKPVQMRRLFDMISGILGMARSPASPEGQIPDDTIVTSHSIAEEQKRSTSILLVEDNPVNRKMASIMLTKAGYSVSTATNGKDVVDMVFEDPMKFDLIFMDVHMPEMDGLEATRRIRKLEAESGTGRRIPIIALTANVLKEFELRCFEAGMDDFLTKPMRRELVFMAVRKWGARHIG